MYICSNAQMCTSIQMSLESFDAKSSTFFLIRDSLINPREFKWILERQKLQNHFICRLFRVFYYSSYLASKFLSRWYNSLDYQCSTIKLLVTLDSVWIWKESHKLILTSSTLWQGLSLSEYGKLIDDWHLDPHVLFDPKGESVAKHLKLIHFRLSWWTREDYRFMWLV